MLALLCYESISAQNLGQELKSSSQSCYAPQLNCLETFNYSQNWSSVEEVTVKLNFHFIRTGDYGLNFGPTSANIPTHPDNNTLTGMKVANDLVDWLNNTAANLQPYTRYKIDDSTALNPPVPFLDTENHPVPNLEDSKLRFEIYSDVNNQEDQYSGIWFWTIQDEAVVHGPLSGYAVCCRDGQTTLSGSSLFDQFSQYGSDVLDVFIYDEWFTSETCMYDDTLRYCYLGRGQAFPGNSGYISISNLWYFVNTNHSFSVLNSASILFHEIVHMFGLGHTFPTNPCCDANEVDRIYGLTNNVMGYNGHSNALSPCQLDQIMAYAHENTKDWMIVGEYNGYCNPNSLPRIEVESDETWIKRKVFQDVVVKSGATLTLKDCIKMAYNVKIHVERGAMLYIENANLSSLCDDKYWGGIRVAGNTSRDHPAHFLDAFNQDGLDPGRVIVINSSISGARIAIHTECELNSTYDPTYWGGYIHCEGSEFKNNRRAAAFMQYRRANKSRFHNCTFFSQSSSSLDEGSQGVSIWDCNGITFTKCTFRDLKFHGIYGLNAGIIVEDENTFKDILGNAIYLGQSSRPILGNTLVRIGNRNKEVNRFEYNETDIRLEGYSGLFETSLIEKNIFSNDRETVCEDNHVAVSCMLSDPIVQLNQFDGYNIGVEMVRSGDFRSRIHNNTFDHHYTGINYREYCGRDIFTCNIFEDYVRAVSVTGTIDVHQGTQNYSNANQWIRSGSYQGKDIFRPKNLENHPDNPFFTYYVQKDEPINGYKRPRCNLTQTCHLPIGESQNQYETFDVEGERDDCVSIYQMPDLDSLDTRSIAEHRDIMDSLAILDTAYLLLPEYRMHSAMKHRKIFLQLDSLFGISDFTGMDTLLSNEPELEYIQMRYSLRLMQDDLESASDFLEAMVENSSEVTRFKVVQREHLRWLEDPLYLPDSTTREALSIIAEKEDLSGVNARALLTWWFDMHWERGAVICEEENNESMDLPEETYEYLDQSAFEQKVSAYKLKVYPNPGNGTFSVILDQSDLSGVMFIQFDIMDITGRTILTHQGNCDISSPITLDFSGKLSPGTYLLQLREDSRKITGYSLIIIK